MRQVANRLGLLGLLVVISGCGGRQTTTTTGSVTTTVVQDSQWVTAAISAGAVLISSAAAAWITHHFTGRTERRRQEHAEIQEAAKREHEAKLSHEQRIREQVIATSTTISKMLQDFRAKIGEATEAADTLAATLLYDECSAIVRRHHDDALPVIEVMPDLELRRRANAVFESYGGWAEGTAEALSNLTTRPDASGLDGTREQYYERARRVIREASD
ncbi:hypothetical protein ACFQ71_03770 [Streptomyces sp. NPDC056534]|uniref:hypothetical protein n=1 Tax=Streptomyces sp. NPDC056534 TaxID=3345857 RepID=UPI0036AFCAB0